MDGLFPRRDSLVAPRQGRSRLELKGCNSENRDSVSAHGWAGIFDRTIARAFLSRIPKGIYNFEGMYSEQLLDHFQNPRNAGDVADPDAAAEIENPACGDVLRLTLKIEAGRIVAIGFKSKGCVPSMACASALTEMIKGKTITQARRLQRDALILAVGGVPEASTHAAQLALDALSTALKQVKA